MHSELVLPPKPSCLCFEDPTSRIFCLSTKFVRELVANGIILVSAVGINGPHYGMLSNPADQAGVIGVAGITKTTISQHAISVANLTILNPASVVGVIKSPPQWIVGTNSEYLAVSTSTPFTLWPYIGSVGVFIAVKEQAANFEGIAKGELRLEVDNGDHVSELLVQVTIRNLPSPQASKRILWDQFHNIPFPSAFVPIDNLDNQHDLMDVVGDYPHTKFDQLWNFLMSEDFFIEILPFEYSCLDLSKYGVALIVDSGEEFFRDEIVVLQAAIEHSNVSLIIFPTSTTSDYLTCSNFTTQSFHTAFGNKVVHSTSVSLLDTGNDSSFPYLSGSYLTNFLAMLDIWATSMPSIKVQGC
uniref:subtilisin n=1 Tax=Peronospora matthiolae TaxID=2874970 RepID=A0AAV1TY46_9STRA